MLTRKEYNKYSRDEKFKFLMSLKVVKPEDKESKKKYNLLMKQLVELGYDKDIGYAGNYSLQWLYTKVFNFFKKFGIKLFNNIVFCLHDWLYALKPTPKEKKLMDKKMLEDDIIMSFGNDFVLSKKNLSVLGFSFYMKNDKKDMWRFVKAILFYVIVWAMTPVYVRQGKVKK